VTAAAAAHAVDPHVRPRAGLGDLPDRMCAGRCTVAYLGASVTVQRDGYRPRLHDLLRDATGHDHRSVFAGTGAMGSITGVFLMDELVLAHRPDVCFVEYTTSDAASTTPLEYLGPALEGIVCKLRDARCEACFLHLYRRDHELATGQVVETYERVADHYGVPSINGAACVRDLIRDGVATESEVLRDVVHTTAIGSELTAEAVSRGVARVFDARSRPVVRPAPLFGESFERTRIVPATRELVRAGAGYSTGRFRLQYPYLELGAAGELRFTPDGDLAGLLVIVGPQSGYIEVETAGGIVEHLLWDEQCSYERLASVVFAPFVRAGTGVTIRLSGRPVDYSSARRPVDPAGAIDKQLKLVGLLVRP
jgi:hypothetical protein